MNKKLLSWSFLAALGEGVYIALVALVMQNANNIFGKTPSIISFMTFLLLFVLSAAISGALILGKPTLMYLGGEKKEAVTLFEYTAGWLFIFLIILFFLLLIF